MALESLIHHTEHEWHMTEKRGIYEGTSQENMGIVSMLSL